MFLHYSAYVNLYIKLILAFTLIITHNGCICTYTISDFMMQVNIFTIKVLTKQS